MDCTTVRLTKTRRALSRKDGRRAGETLVETIIAFAVLMLVLTMVTTAVQAAIRLNNRAIESANVLEVSSGKAETYTGSPLQSDVKLNVTFPGNASLTPFTVTVDVMDTDPILYFEGNE